MANLIFAKHTCATNTCNILLIPIFCVCLGAIHSNALGYSLVCTQGSSSGNCQGIICFWELSPGFLHAEHVLGWLRLHVKSCFFEFKVNIPTAYLSTDPNFQVQSNFQHISVVNLTPWQIIYIVRFFPEFLVRIPKPPLRVRWEWIHKRMFFWKIIKKYE